MITTRTSEQPKTSLKLRKCRICRQSYRPWRPLQQCCGPDCEHAYAMQVVAKKKAKEAAAERAAIKARKEKIKTRSDHIKDTQIAFNSFVRERDKNKPCICCGKHLSSDSVGGVFDCGHYRSIGSAPHLRFDPRNAHGQRKQCNRYGAGRAIDYRLGLVARLGIAVVELLEQDQEPRKWTIDELRNIRDEYRTKLRELKLKSAD